MKNTTDDFYEKCSKYKDEIDNLSSLGRLRYNANYVDAYQLCIATPSLDEYSGANDLYGETLDIIISFYNTQFRGKDMDDFYMKIEDFFEIRLTQDEVEGTLGLQSLAILVADKISKKG